MRHRCPWIATAAGVLLCACAAQPPHPPAPPPPRAHVSYHAVADKHATHYQVTSMQTIVSPLPSMHNRPPVYPPQLVARHLPPLTVRVKLIVDTKGRVGAARFAQANTDDAVRRAFQRAVRAAVTGWRFGPLTIEQWVAEPDGGQKVVKSTPKPFSQDYVFRFRLVNGKPVVTNGAVPAPAASSATR